MDESRNPRIDPVKGVSPLEQLREVVRQNPAEGEFLKAQKKKLTALQVIAQIESRHNIYGLDSPRLSDFWRWLQQRQWWNQVNHSVQDLREDFAKIAPEATDEQMHRYLVDMVKSLLPHEADSKERGKLLKLAVVETRKRVEMDQSARRLRMLEQERAATKDILENKELTPEEREQRLKEKFGIA